MHQRRYSTPKKDAIHVRHYEARIGDFAAGGAHGRRPSTSRPSDRRPQLGSGEWAEELASLYGGHGTYRGLGEIGDATLEWFAAWDAYWMTAEEFVEIGDQVLVTMRLHGRTADTASVIEQGVIALWALRDGKAVRVRFYTDPLEAQAVADIRR